MKIFLLLLFCLAGFGQKSQAQKQGQNLIDSIVKALPGLPDDTDHVWLLNDLAQAYYSIDPKKGVEVGYQELALAKKIGYIRGITVAYGIIGNNYYALSDYYKALEVWQLATVIEEKYNIKEKEVTIMCIANVYFALGEYDKAATSYLQVIQFYRQNKDKTIKKNAPLGMCYSNLGAVYFKDNKKSQAIASLDTAISYLVLANSDEDLARAYMNLGSIVSSTGNYKRAFTLFDSATALYRNLGDDGGLAVSLTNKSLSYTDLLQDTSAYTSFFQSSGISKPKLIADAITTLDSSIEIHKRLSMLQSLPVDYNGLARMFALSGNMYAAYHALINREIWQDSLFNDKSLKNLMRLDEQYKFGKREDSLKYQQQLVRSKFLQQQQLTSAQLIQQRQQVELRQSALDLSNQQLTIAEKEKEVQSLAFEKQQGEYIRAQQSKDNELKLAAQQSKIQTLEIQSSHRTRLAFIAGLLLLAGVAAFVIRQSALRKKANHQLAFSNRQLDEANRVKARFFGILSHDLRAPVSNLTSFLYLQREAPEMMDERARKSHQLTIELAANNLLSVMEDLLLWSKGQMTNFKPTIKTVQVLQLFEEIKKLLPYDTTTDVVFDDPGLLKIDTDENFLKTIMRNLTANALKALGNQPDGKVEWKAWEEGGKSFMSITDNGPGLTKEQLENLFSESAVTSAKTGLGLHMVRDFAQMLGQKIEVRSEPGRGTSFILSRAA